MLRQFASTIVVGLIALLAGGCGSSPGPTDAGTTPDAGPGMDAGGGLSWFTTCGYPVCMAPTDAGTVDAGACPSAGTACSTMGQMCGTASAANCGVTEVCAASDPKLAGCPISSRRYKDGIEYLDEAALQKLHDETVRLRLATYHYRSAVADPVPPHLGFIIEDQPPQSPAVEASREHVDLVRLPEHGRRHDAGAGAGDRATPTRVGGDEDGACPHSVR